MSGRAWTTGEIKRLEEMNAQGLSNQQIASKLNRTKQAIANQKYLQALVMPKKIYWRNHLRWREWEDDLLGRLPKLSAKQISERILRTEEAVKQRRKVLRKRKK